VNTYLHRQNATENAKQFYRVIFVTEYCVPHTEFTTRKHGCSCLGLPL